MYYIKVRNCKTKEEFCINFESREEALLYRNYNWKFAAWDGKETWVAEKFIKPSNKIYIVDEKEINILDENKEVVKTKYFKIRPEYEFISDNLNIIRTELLWDKLRKDRNVALKETDFTQLADAPMSNAEKGKYREYRHYLRNLPLNFNEESIGRATIMSFEDWKEFFRK